MTAGEFATATGLSPKALRIYADAGILSPSFVDSSNGYRYYDPAQVQTATTIILLRGAGASIAEIGRFLDNPTPGELTRWEFDIRSDARRRSECLEELRHRFGWSNASKGDVMATVTEIQDIEELAEVFTVLGSYFAPQFDSSDRRFGDVQRRFPEDQRFMTVATIDGSRVGGCLAFRSGDDALTLRIIAVVPSQRRQGIGRQLVEHLENEASDVGVTSIALGTDDAVGFWFRLGYSPLLLLQWAFDAEVYERERDSLLSGPLKGLEYSESSFNDVPQLFVKLDEPRLDLRDVVRNALAGCHVGFCLTKPTYNALPRDITHEDDIDECLPGSFNVCLNAFE